MPKPLTAAPVDDPALSIHDTAERLHTTPEVLRKWRYQRKGPESFLLAGKVVYLRSAVQAFIDAERARTSRGGLQPPPRTRRPA